MLNASFVIAHGRKYLLFWYLLDWESRYETQELSLKPFRYDDVLMKRITSYGLELSTFRENRKGEDLFERQLVSQETFIRQETLTHKESLTEEIDHKYNKPGKIVHLDNAGEKVYDHKSDKRSFPKIPW